MGPLNTLVAALVIAAGAGVLGYQKGHSDAELAHKAALADELTQAIEDNIEDQKRSRQLADGAAQIEREVRSHETPKFDRKCPLPDNYYSLR